MIRESSNVDIEEVMHNTSIEYKTVATVNLFGDETTIYCAPVDGHRYYYINWMFGPYSEKANLHIEECRDWREEMKSIISNALSKVLGNGYLVNIYNIHIDLFGVWIPRTSHQKFWYRRDFDDVGIALDNLKIIRDTILGGDKKMLAILLDIVRMRCETKSPLALEVISTLGEGYSHNIHLAFDIALSSGVPRIMQSAISSLWNLPKQDRLIFLQRVMEIAKMGDEANQFVHLHVQ